MLQKTYRLPRLCPQWSRVVQLQQQQQHRLSPLPSRAESTFRHATDLLSERSHHGKSTCCAARARTTTPLLQSHEFSLQPLQVRPHEVDQYSVVNNAVFVQYLQHARHAWLQAEDLEEREEIPAYALSELNVKYKAPLRSQDWYIVTVGIKEYTRTRVVCAQRVIRLDPESEQADRVVAEALATVVLLDRGYRPLRMPGFFKQAVEKYQPMSPA